MLTDKRSSMDEEVIEIIETFIDLLNSFPVAVRKFDLEELHEYMAEKAEDFYTEFKGRAKHGENEVRLEKDVVYIYSYSSIVLVLGTHLLLYPFMLVTGANYHDLIPLLCRELKKTQYLTLTIFFNIY